jgi:hypothetical protein
MMRETIHKGGKDDDDNVSAHLSKGTDEGT